jgi:hypothetical protein
MLVMAAFATTSAVVRNIDETIRLRGLDEDLLRSAICGPGDRDPERFAEFARPGASAGRVCGVSSW